MSPPSCAAIDIRNATMFELSRTIGTQIISTRFIKIRAGRVMQIAAEFGQKYRGHDTKTGPYRHDAFSETIRIDAPIDRVLATLADVGAIAEWNPGLVGSKPTNEISGLGATRFCDIDGRQNPDEEVAFFEPERAITFRRTRSTLPFCNADIKVTLAADGQETVVSFSPEYRLKHRRVGFLIEPSS